MYSTYRVGALYFAPSPASRYPVNAKARGGKRDVEGLCTATVWSRSGKVETLR